MSNSILVVDAHENVAEALAHLFSSAGFSPAVVAPPGQPLIDLVDRVRPNIVTIDLGVEDQEALHQLERLRARWPHLPVLVISASGTLETVMQCLDAGANGFVSKSARPEDLVRAAQAVADLHTWIPVELIGAVINHLQNPPPPSDWQVLVQSLSPREYEVLELMVDGLGRREIAEQLTISLNTVRTHVKNILAKLGVHASLEAVSLGLRAGLRPRLQATA